MAPMLCSLWARIVRETAAGDEQTAAVDAMYQKFACVGK
jgi:hypothetical protein